MSDTDHGIQAHDSTVYARRRPALPDMGSLILNSYRLILTPMVRPKLPPDRKKQKVTITPAREVLEFIDARIGVGKKFKDRTHGFEYAVGRLIEEEREDTS